MTRIDLAGKGGPIPTVALPAPGEDTTFPPQVFLLENGSSWDKTDYVGLGYTNYEVWCVGAAGGMGSLVSLRPRYEYVTERKVMPGSYPHGDLWGAYIRMQELFYERWGNPNPFPGTTIAENAQYYNPTHEFDTRVFSGKILHEIDYNFAGGGGGGGGVHVVRGELADLPVNVSAIVGQGGQDAPIGQIHQNAPWIPLGADFFPSWYFQIGWGQGLMGYEGEPSGGLPPPGAEEIEMFEGVRAWMRNYFTPATAIPTPQLGGDGGYSAFGDVCRASGGTGGKPAKSWDGSTFVFDGDGGQGGVGDQTDPGGGALGGDAPPPIGWSPTGGKLVSPGKDGTWDQVSIGQGGGGGHSGVRSQNASSNPGGTGVYQPARPTIPGSSGGKGSFSYADTSIYGPGQSRQIVGDQPIGGGGGGGVKADKKLKYGSRASGFNPNGLVFLRVYKVDD